MSNELILEIKASMIATDVNAHAQFNHADEVRKEKPATLIAWRAFLPKEVLHVRTLYAFGVAGSVSVGAPIAPPIPPRIP
jgi:hypothetical protein